MKSRLHRLIQLSIALAFGLAVVPVASAQSSAPTGTEPAANALPGSPVCITAKASLPPAPGQQAHKNNAAAKQAEEQNSAATSAITNTDTGKKASENSGAPDELASDLAALAGPTTGPNGGQIFVEGFAIGKLSPMKTRRK